jgi:hypothetical protein
VARDVFFLNPVQSEVEAISPAVELTRHSPQSKHARSKTASTCFRVIGARILLCTIITNLPSVFAEMPATPSDNSL